MSEINVNIIDKSIPRPLAENYDKLRELGLEYIRKLSGNIWTDHNSHDPGITILELLCFALTDLGYRTSFPINDILTNTGENGPVLKNTFYTASQILITHPVTSADYRKFIIDTIPGVTNVWFMLSESQKIYYNKITGKNTFVKPASNFEQTSLQGLYKILVELEHTEIIFSQHKSFIKKLETWSKKTITEKNHAAIYSQYISKILMQCRNINEDFNTVEIVEPEYVSICADIDLKPGADTEQVYLAIYYELYNYINPSIPRYTISELIKKGLTPEEIFSGPLPEHGFIDNIELINHKRREILYTSDIINLLMDIEGILAIRSITLNSFQFLGNGVKYLSSNERYQLKLLNKNGNAAFRFHLDYSETPKKRQNNIMFRKGLLYFNHTLQKTYKIEYVTGYKKTPENFQNDFDPPTGINRNLEEYISIQDEFPKNYKLGREGIPDSATTLRKAQRLQLKAYLVFFDQLLANYLALLNQTKNILSWNSNTSNPTYPYLKLTNENITDFDKIFGDYPELEKILENTETKTERHSRILDHLLARFNEKFVDYSVVKFVQKQGSVSYDSFSPNEIIKDKTEFLKQYPVISCNRSHAFDYTENANATNYTTLELRLCKVLGIDNMQHPISKAITDDNGNILKDNNGKYRFTDNRFAQFDKSFGFYIIEHLLLRPQFGITDVEPLQIALPKLANNNFKVHPDPYSFTLTIVVPGWLAISNRIEFRQFVEKQIRLEAPAHMGIKICWIDPYQMFIFEKAYTNYLLILIKLKNAQKKMAADVAKYKDALNNVTEILSQLKNMYPPSVLESGYDILEGEQAFSQSPVILDQTALGGGMDVNYVFE